MILGVGCDIVKIQRLAEKADGIAARILTDKEQNEYCACHGHRKLEYLAEGLPRKRLCIKYFMVKENYVTSKC